MTVSLKHIFQSTKDDSGDVTIVQPSNWNEEHVLTCSTARILGRTTAGTGVVEELSVGDGLSLSAGTLAVGTVPVANGGTGATTLTANNVLLGNGTSAVQTVAPGTSGNVLTSNGTTWASTAPPNGWTQIAALTTTSGTTATFSSIPSTYTQLLVVYAGVSHNDAVDPNALQIALSDNGSTYTTALSISNQLDRPEFTYGSVFVPGYTKSNGLLMESGGNADQVNRTFSASNSVGYGWRIDAGIAYIRFSWDSGASFDAGTITLFGG
jgi:hypothetical protein